MAINGFPQYTIIQPTKPFFAELDQVSPTYDTYYTALDITAGTGKIKRIVAMNYRDNKYQTADNINVRITVDGNSYTLERSSGDLALVAGRNTIGGSSTNTNAHVVFLCESEIYFYKSIKIEIKETSNATVGTGYRLSLIADYSLI